MTMNKEELTEQYNKVSEAMKELVAAMPEEQRHKSEKILALIDLVTSTACAVAETLSKMESLGWKRIFPKISRSLLRRVNKKRIKQSNERLAAQAVENMYFASLQANIAASAPIPNYTKGCGYVSGGLLPMGGDERELVIQPAVFTDMVGKQIKLRDAFYLNPITGETFKKP